MVTSVNIVQTMQHLALVKIIIFLYPQHIFVNICVKLDWMEQLGVILDILYSIRIRVLLFPLKVIWPWETKKKENVHWQDLLWLYNASYLNVSYVKEEVYNCKIGDFWEHSKLVMLINGSVRSGNDLIYYPAI